MTSPMLKGITANRKERRGAFNKFRTIQPVSRIAFVPF
jgi:hypothetical protein